MTNHPDIDRVCRLGTISDCGNVFVAIRYSDDRLSITGVVGPLSSGDARGSCGQITLRPESFDAFAPGWSADDVRQLAEYWQRWHSNDMRPGTPKQSELIRQREAEAGERYSRSPHGYAHDQGFDSAYDLHVSWLAKADLLEDDGYRYGSEWLHEDVPAEVLEWLASRPEADQAPAWV